MQLIRSLDNPILLPSQKNSWESVAAYNGCVVKVDNDFHMVYRALSSPQVINGHSLQVSSIGYAKSNDGIHFSDHRQLFKPTESWEIYGCEDPRITYMNGKYYIFYTALSVFPFAASGIKSALAITRDLQTIDAKYLVTPFNAKAMSLFPDVVNNRYAVIVTANTDQPPAKIGIAYLDKEEELWSGDFWTRWYDYLDDHVIPLQREDNSQVEIGSPPIKTEDGWLLLYAYIKNYFSDQKLFTIEAALLDTQDPRKLVNRIPQPLLQPVFDYEKFGHVPNIVFPSGSLLHDKKLFVYYGGADTVTCVATCDTQQLLHELAQHPVAHTETPRSPIGYASTQLQRFVENPILAPITEHPWEAKATFNAGAIHIDDTTSLLYRAMSDKNISTIGYGETIDGYHISKRFDQPIYTPREIFETNKDGGNYGCEDPRLTLIDDRVYMCYTAYDGHNSPRVALTSISIDDFRKKQWHWAIPKLISPPGIDDKDACILSKKINGKYMLFHRLETFIWIDFTDDLHFYEGNYLGGSILLKSRKDKWDSHKVGIAAPPIETQDGWLLLYHGIGDDGHYRVGAALLDLIDPRKILGRTNDPILEPQMHNETDGQVRDVVFPCGAILRANGDLIVYYGGADAVTNVATVKIQHLLSLLKHSHL